MGGFIAKSIIEHFMRFFEDFWNNFGWLLQESERIKIYTHQNFAAHPVSYCGMKITDEPTYNSAKDGGDMSIGEMS